MIAQPRSSLTYRAAPRVSALFLPTAHKPPVGISSTAGYRHLRTRPPTAAFLAQICSRDPPSQKHEEDWPATRNWVTAGQAEALLQPPDLQKLKGKRDRALLAVLLACGLKRHEAVELKVSHLQKREEHWAIIDLVGKAAHTRRIPVPHWVKDIIDDWLEEADVTSGEIFLRVNRAGRIWRNGMTARPLIGIFPTTWGVIWKRPSLH
jgi:integrase